MTYGLGGVAPLDEVKMRCVTDLVAAPLLRNWQPHWEATCGLVELLASPHTLAAFRSTRQDTDGLLFVFFSGIIIQLCAQRPAGASLESLQHELLVSYNTWEYVCYTVYCVGWLLPEEACSPSMTKSHPV